MLFNSLLDNTNDKNQLSKLYHNLGNSQYKENKFEQAVESFKSSLNKKHREQKNTQRQTETKKNKRRHRRTKKAITLSHQILMALES